jgi:hypothetical protein
VAVLVSVVVLSALFIAPLGTGCGGDDEPATAGALPACAEGGKQLRRPAQLPRDFPLPPGLVLRFARYDEPGVLGLSGVAPGDLDSVADFFEDELPKRGYNLGRGDEEAGEKEAPFTGRGFRGGWRVNAMRNCAAVVVNVVLIRQ